MLHARTGLVLATVAAVAPFAGVLKPHSGTGLDDIGSSIGGHGCRPSQ